MVRFMLYGAVPKVEDLMRRIESKIADSIQATFSQKKEIS